MTSRDTAQMRADAAPGAPRRARPLTTPHQLSPEDIWSQLDGKRVVIPSGCAQPIGFLSRVRPQLVRKGVEIVAGILPGGYGFLDADAPLRLTSWHPAGAPQGGPVEVLPLIYSQLTRELAAGGSYPAEALIVHVAPPDADGYCSFGTSASYTFPLAQAVPQVFAIVNRHMPRTAGAHLPMAHFSATCFLDEPLVEYRRVVPDEIDERIAEHVATIVPNGGTVQVGIGKVPEALPRALEGHRDIGLAGILTDAGVALMRTGVADLESQSRPGVFEFGELMGGKVCFDFAAEHPAIRMVGNDYLFAESVLGSIDKLIAVNSALEVDLTGQVNAESLGQLQVTGPGGQLDFMRFASRSTGGASIVALRAVGRDGRSTIRRTLDPGAVVTTPRAFVTHVVTEYGVASLRGRTLRERADELIRIASPDVRDELLRGSTGSSR